MVVEESPTHPAPDRGRVDLPGRSEFGPAMARRMERATGAFVILGVLLRVAHYLLNEPLWWDEAFVAVNFLRRGYLDLLGPLDYGQIAPPLFLWAELAAVRLLGFSEWSLRLVPLLCGVASVFLFRHLAGKILRGLPLLMAVGIFAVSFHPIRHAADVKPYASDLLAALALLTIAVAWWREPRRMRRLWALAALAPLALLASNPAVFVAGGIGLGLAPAVGRSRDRRAWAAFVMFLVVTAATFATEYVLFTRPQAADALPGLKDYWDASFPPLGSPVGLARWLIVVHTGTMFAYPGGGQAGASTPALLLFLVGAWVLARRGRGPILAACLGPFGLALIAAALRKHPYGGAARFMQFVAPSICLLVGLGAAALMARIPGPRGRAWAIRLGVAVLVAVGVGPLVDHAAHPYRHVQAQAAREFARRFWPEQARGAELACLRWDLRVCEWDSTDLNTAVYLCNQAIYSPARHREAGPPRLARSAPLRCVLFHSDPDGDPRVVDWLDEMQSRGKVCRRSSFVVAPKATTHRPHPERYTVFEFAPGEPRIASR